MNGYDRFLKGYKYRQLSYVVHSEAEPLPYSEIEKRLLAAFEKLGVDATNKSGWVGVENTLKQGVWLSCAFDILPDEYFTSLSLLENLRDETGFDFCNNIFWRRREKEG